MSNYINHVAFILDGSSSMRGLSDSVVKVFNNQIKHLADASKTFDQETRVSVYLFNDSVHNLIFDKDVLRLPSIDSMYKAYGNTALIDGAMTGITDLALTCQKYGDHAFLMFVLTDGQENTSRKYKQYQLKDKLDTLPDNWTVAVLVPSATDAHYAKQAGFKPNNIQIWSTTERGMEEIDNKLRNVTTQYMQSRKQGVKSFTNVFDLQTDKLVTQVVKQQLKELTKSKFALLPVSNVCEIKPFVESCGMTYTQGCAYYQLSKNEKIQANKQICVQNKKNGKVFTGTEARNILGLPNYEVKVSPVNADFTIFVQSTSVNRKLMPNTNLLVLR